MTLLAYAQILLDFIYHMILKFRLYTNKVVKTLSFCLIYTRIPAIIKSNTCMANEWCIYSYVLSALACNYCIPSYSLVVVCMCVFVH